VGVTGADLDHKEHVHACESDRAVDVQEVAGQHRVGLGTQELPPAGLRSLRRGWQAPTAQQPLDRGAADAVPELAQLALDTNIAPSRVLDSEPSDQIGEFAVHTGLATTVGG
jgi:hypothetical protein